RNKVANSTQ
ncbi:cytochrome C and Quinol oxidase polypeptide I family protein, partial [Vibrio parahaemolyticus V-223/04]